MCKNNQVKSYVIWNPDHVNSCASIMPENADTTTYAGLLAVEEANDASISSQIETADINSIIDAIHNETNILLNHHCLSD